jgi:predicted short-subunit dehydrogenase-like oxidoreductase (DUF2520 family)
MRKTLNIIGCGKLGKTLGRLWNEAGTFSIQSIANRSLESGQRAVTFIGAGQAVEAYADMRPADIWLIATQDDQIAECARALAQTSIITPSDVVFHCSGALPAAVLNPVSGCGAVIASVHPIRSFADPAHATAVFAGTFCGIEGDPVALALLDDAFAAIGARTVPIDAEFKTLYHAAAVFASNYLVTLLDIAAQAYEKAGIPREVALQLMEPLARGTMDNVFQSGPESALTGPIARGDIGTAVKQYRAVSAWDDRHGALYKQLGKLTADLARRQRENSSKEDN